MDLGKIVLIYFMSVNVSSTFYKVCLRKIIYSTEFALLLLNWSIIS